MGYCRETTRAEIARVIDQFGAAARVMDQFGAAADAGFDAMGLHFGHLYLPSSCLSPSINRRKDECGGQGCGALGPLRANGLPLH